MTRGAYRAAIGCSAGGRKRAAGGAIPREARSRADGGAMGKAAVMLVALVALLGLAQADRECRGRAGARARGADPSFGVAPRAGLPPLSTPPSPQ